MRDAAAPEKDNPRIQKERIERVIFEMNPLYRVEFYQNRVDPKTTDIRFKIYDTSTKKIVCSIKQDREWAASQIADKSDSELRRKIAELIDPLSGS